VRPPSSEAARRPRPRPPPSTNSKTPRIPPTALYPPSASALRSLPLSMQSGTDGAANKVFRSRQARGPSRQRGAGSPSLRMQGRVIRRRADDPETRKFREQVSARSAAGTSYARQGRLFGGQHRRTKPERGTALSGREQLCRCRHNCSRRSGVVRGRRSARDAARRRRSGPARHRRVRGRQRDSPTRCR
jgi:hypothetical protein